MADRLSKACVVAMQEYNQLQHDIRTLQELQKRYRLDLKDAIDDLKAKMPDKVRRLFVGCNMPMRNR